MSKDRRDIKKGLVNSFGSMGYLCCALAWFWTGMLYLNAVRSAVLFVQPVADERIAYDIPSVAIPSQLEVGIIVVVTIIMVLITLYALVKIPMSVAKSGGKIMQKTTDTLVPIAIKAQHKEDTKKNRMKIAPKLLILIKLFLVIVPIVLSMLSELFGKLPIDYSIAVIVSGGIGGLSVFFFSMQYLLAGALRVKSSGLW